MKNVFSSERKIGIVLMSVFAIFWIISVCILVNAAYPDIKHRILVSVIAIGSLAFISLLGIGFLYNRTPLSKFGSLSSNSKLYYSIIYLFLSVFCIWCIEYLIYQTNKEQFSIEQRYLDKSIQDRAESITAELGIYQHFENIYKQLASGISPTKNYDYLNVNHKIYTIVGSDTLIIHLHRMSPMTPKMAPPHKKDEIDYCGVRSIGISTLNEPYNLSHPSSRNALTCMKLNGYIQGDDLARLIHEKGQFYNQRCIKFEKLLADNQEISFPAFLIYHFFNYSSISNGTNVMIRILVLLQTIIITFLSGYIFKTLYKIMDGE